MSNLISIRIGSSADTAGFEKADAAIHKITDSAKGMVAALAAGVAIDLGGRLVGSLAAIPNILQDAIANGVRFNAELESAKLGIAAIYKQFAGEKFTTFDDALAGADKATEALKAKAKETNATFGQLLGSYQGSVGSLFAAGITDVQKQVDTVGLLANAVSAVVADKAQLLQETKAILTGNIGPDAQAAKTFGITAEDIKTAKEAGNLYEFLETKLSAFAEAGRRGGETFSVAMGNLEEAITDLEAKVALPIFEALREGILALSAELSKPEAVDALKAIGFAVGAIVTDGMAMIEWAVKNADALSALAQGATILGVALAAMKIAQVTVALGAWAASLLTSGTAVNAETAALARNTAAQVANAGARRANAGAAAAGTAAAGPMLSRAAWLQETRRLQPGGTTYAAYGANALGGVVTGGIGSAAERGLGGAGVPGWVAGLRGGVNSMGVGGAVNVAAAGVGIGAGIYASRYAAAASGTGQAGANYGMLLNLEKQRESVLALIRGADDLNKKAEAKLALEEQIKTVRDSLAQLDVEGEKMARLELVNLDRLVQGFERIAGSKAAAIALPPLYDGSEQQKKDLAKRAADDKTINRASAVTGENLRVESDDPQTRIQALRDRVTRQREELGAGNILFDKDRLQTDTPEELRGKAGQGVNAEFVQSKLAEIEAIAAAERAVTEELKKQGAALESNMAAEADRFFAEQKQRDEMVKATMEQIAGELELGEKRNAALADLETERQILAAQLAGRGAEAKALERKRELEKEIAGLEREGLTHAEAKAKAGEKAALQAQIEAKAKGQNQAQIEADMAVDEAKTHRSKKGVRDAEENALRLRKTKEFGDAGFEGAELDRMVGSAVDVQRRQNRTPGHIGPAVNLDPAGGLHSGGLTSGTNATDPADWNRIFHGGIAPLVPGVPGAPAPETKGGDPLTAAAKSAAGADAALKERATAMAKSLDGVKTTADNTFEQMKTTCAAMEKKMGEIATNFKTLESKVDAMRTE